MPDHTVYRKTKKIAKRKNLMKIVYQEKDNWFIGHIQEYPDYETQGETLEELKANLVDIYQDIVKGLVPDAEPFKVLEVAV